MIRDREEQVTVTPARTGRMLGAIEVISAQGRILASKF